MTKGCKDILGSDGNFRYVDCSGGFTGMYTFTQTHQIVHLKSCSLLYRNYTIIILFKNFLPLRFFLLFKYISLGLWSFPSGSAVKNPSAVQKPQETWVRSLGQKIPQRREWHPTPEFLLGESRGQRNLMSYSP